MSPDRPDVSFAAKELAKSMAKQTKGDWCRLKRLGRYLAAKPRMQILFELQGGQRELIAYSDADWAGDIQSRKSTSGGVAMRGRHCLRTWSKTQATIAKSSVE